MAIKRCLVVALTAVSLGLGGCAAVLIGTGAAGGYALGKDSVTDYFDLSQERVFRQSIQVVKELGLVTLEDEAHGVIKATVDDAKVTITVKPVSKKTVELKVKARKMLMPKVTVAQKVYDQISDGL